MSRSVRVAPECIATIKLALRSHGFPSQNSLAIELGISRTTTTRFFTGKPVDYLNFVEISEKLGLDWQAIAYIEEEISPEAGSPPPEPQTPQQIDLDIDWRQVASRMLEAQNQGRLTTNPLTTGDGVAFELDEIYVPLGLVERKQRVRRSSDVFPEQGSQLYVWADFVSSQDEVNQTFRQEEFFEQVLRQGHSRKIAILGEPGAGKTTLLQKIAAWVINHTSDVPIWISLADLQEKTLEEYLLQDWLKAATRKVRITETMQEALGDLFNSGRVWLLLDAVDEMVMGSTTGGEPLQAIAKQLMGWVADARVVLTCRLNVWDAAKNALEAFDTYRNLDFSYGDAQTPDQVGQFIRSWFKDKPALAEQLRSQLNQPGLERIKDAVKNPLRLALLCRTWALAQGELPNTKAGLYQQFAEALYEWKQDRFPTTLTERQQLNKALGELAIRALTQEKTKFRLRHSLVGSVLGKPDEGLFDLALQLGWLNQVGVAAEAKHWGEKLYAFYHPTFQEYFAAQAIEDWQFFFNHKFGSGPDFSSPILGIPLPWEGTYRIFESQWREVILLWLGRKNVARKCKEEFIKALLEFDDGCGEFCFNGYRYKGFYEYRAYFLAAAGIAEFADCSQSDEIIAELIKWGFGDFEAAKQEWVKFFDLIEKAARATLPETNRSKVIKALVRLLQLTEDGYTRWLAVYQLGKIGTGNPDAITALEQLLEVPEDESIRWQAADSLGRIDHGNQKAITALVEMIASTESEYIRWQAADSLGKIGTENPEAIAALEQLVESTKNESIRRRATYSLRKIDANSQEIISVLVPPSESFEEQLIPRQAVDSLEIISTVNPEAIAALVQLLESTQDEETLWLAAYSLGEVAMGNHQAIRALVQLLESTDNESTRRQAADSLGKIGAGNPRAISALVQLVDSIEDESTRRRTADSLGKIGAGNPTAISALVKLLYSTNNEYTREQAAYNLGKIGSKNPSAIMALMQLIDTTVDKYTSRQAADSLGKIDPGNETAIAALVQLIQSLKDESIGWQAADSLKKVLRKEQLNRIIVALKDDLSDEIYKNEAQRFYQCYELIWYCAQTMSYPDFYQAWHTQDISDYSPDLIETTIVGFTTLNHNLNPAELPQSLAVALRNYPSLSENIQLICIDGSKFIDRDNPAAKIYTEMVKGGCLRCDDGIPKTMTELQAYWDLLESDKRVILLFHDSTSIQQGGVGFSKKFLEALSKFDGAICVITAQPLNNIPLQFFDPKQPIAEVVQWLNRLAPER
ncbi:HEAT repeat domain-containing protein [Lyngbya aestuarii]|uniref:HEAT repeat domain-containing protein n=1 Tax=Lyngbya aestuarii TaxID=118322 RepID=UPI00403DDC14